MTSDPMDVLRADPIMRELVEEHGPVELEPAEDPFRRLVVSIINQQLSSASASAIKGRVFDQHEITPRAMLAAEEDSLRDAGLSHQKIEYVRNVAEAFIEDDLSRATFEDLSDEAVIDRLTEIRGIGVWTGKMFCIFCLAREDVFPVEDLGIRRGMEELFGNDLTRAAMVEEAERWRPFRSYASRYLWRVPDG